MSTTLLASVRAFFICIKLFNRIEELFHCLVAEPLPSLRLAGFGRAIVFEYHRRSQSCAHACLVR